jgi:FtsH-binding integral membrane protein
MSSTKYTPAPQNDPSYTDNEPSSYTQAPPSYQATTSADDDEALLRGGSRSSIDNVPDDFKFGGVVGEGSIEVRMGFIRRVYAILTVQLVATGILSSISFYNGDYKQWIQSNQWMMWISLFGAIGFMLLTYWKRKSYPTNLLFLSGFTALEAYSISVIVSFYDSSIVLEALIITGGLFIGLTLFACQTKYDFTSWIPYLFGALWGLILVGFVASFSQSSGVQLAMSGVTALIFCAYILVDTQLIMRHYHVEEEIAAAISLYLDIINLFLAILRILNSQQNN